MTLFEMTQLVCGELPAGFEIIIRMENGAGACDLFPPNQEIFMQGDLLQDADLEEQIIELVKMAKGEPSKYDDFGVIS